MKEAHEQSLKRDTKLMTAQQILDNTSPSKSARLPSPPIPSMITRLGESNCPPPASTSLAYSLVALPYPKCRQVSAIAEMKSP